MKALGEKIDLPIRYRRLKTALTLVTSMLALIAVGSSFLAFSYQRHIIEASRYNSTFDLGQTAVELLRLQFALKESEISRDIRDVSFRLNILTNRLKILSSSPANSEPKQKAMLENLTEAVSTLEPLVVEPHSPAAMRNAVALLQPFVAPVLRLGSISHASVGDEIQQNQSQLSIIFATICFVTMTFVAFGTVLLWFVFRQNAKLDRVLRVDPLTGIANRVGFSASISMKSDVEQALIVLDVDHFKTINDTLGHASGDQLLIGLSQRLATACRGAKVIARIGGDEFAILYSGPNAVNEATKCCERILLETCAPFKIDGRLVPATVSLGIGSVGVNPDHGSTLFKNADIALYEAKKSGRNRFTTFHPDMNQQLTRWQHLQKDLGDAIENGELFLLFQPIVDLATGSTRGFEALVRWQHRKLGLISPTEFIPIAEESGQIGPIGAWVIDAACHQAAVLPTETFIAVNVSAAQLTNPSLVLHTRACLTRHCVSPQRLEIEITESTLIENDERALAVLHELRRMGCRISLDDFGTGYASLSYLRRFPFDKIKIDQSFLRGASHREEGIAIIAGTCDLAHRLNLTIVAEGIETEEDLGIVKAAGSHQGQGYLFDKPLTAKESVDRTASKIRSPVHERCGSFG
ncbi:putative bifunctional diguanylate cyclase/phosphodiesterase (plasmid) [Agrobacterium rosae]|uniref:Bifunctional diguanylate cyclase/phosphodiesterase n=1 Tax=Agrobacterium rosae TaxID=1972867 RepID=A0AAE5RTX3_9HYPH|nr:bifunctional diguanylate cyclase/phosphodiesterase [Agrobacterium rosae]KAA3507799.1 bifunctional diguanylate cyclase/phosphodiesterase [Agrobacterium rosae]KAA3512778.1 bifunctional diguanylate cyclase/phosphodiesterase [Agrobacterium rosae]MBN7808309.1 bifunctional diguanylate cyclase/phosphodiesterase [Agrobacterium rosae]MCM2436111.1 bifunctional diguanylate cyclase/phosphodiesterase [Agrobacterium rosae]MDX8305663.1 bifunctional diguanylate cyclase/phosphodiesterase [Agrobacterium rosa